MLRCFSPLIHSMREPTGKSLAIRDFSPPFDVRGQSTRSSRAVSDLNPLVNWILLSV
jgi:hypothetical protein